MQTFTVGVVGAGFMGSGIAESAARSGVRVAIFESEASALERSRARIAQSLERAVRGGKLEEGDVGPLLDRIDWTTELDARVVSGHHGRKTGRGFYEYAPDRERVPS